MEIITNISELIISAGIVQGFFLAALLFRAGKQNRKAFFAAAIVFVFTLNLTLGEGAVRFFQASPVEYLFLLGPFQLFFGPMLYFYTRAITEQSFKHSPENLFHFIPLFLYLLQLAVYHLFPGSLIYNHFIEGMGIINITQWILIFIQLGIYLSIINKKIKAYKSELKKEYSAVEKYDLDWMTLLMKFFIILNGLNLFILFWYLHDFHLEGIQKILAIAGSAIIYFLGYRSFFRKEISAAYQKAGQKTDKKKDAQYSRSSLDESRIDWFWDKLNTHMKKEKPYLEPELTLGDLAESVKLSSHHLSEILSRKNKSFYEYVNSFRLDEIQRLLRAPSRNSVSILNLAFEAGFNSKTTFNTLFKKCTGMTPSGYRKIKACNQ